MDKQYHTERIAKALYGLYCGNDKCDSCKCPRNCENYHCAERLVKKGIGDIKTAIKEFAEELKPLLDKLALKIAVALDCYEDKNIELMARKAEEAHELCLKLNKLVKERQCNIKD